MTQMKCSKVPTRGKVQCQCVLLAGRWAASQPKLHSCLYIIECQTGFGNSRRNFRSPSVMYYWVKLRCGNELHLSQELLWFVQRSVPTQ